MTHIAGAGGLSYLRHFDALRTTIDTWLTPKGFNKNIFCHELDQTLLKTEAYKSKDPDSKFAEIFQEFLHKHTPLKSKHIRSNHAPFMNKEFSKVTMTKFRLRNKFLKWSSRENFPAYKRNATH